MFHCILSCFNSVCRVKCHGVPVRPDNSLVLLHSTQYIPPQPSATTQQLDPVWTRGLLCCSKFFTFLCRTLKEFGGSDSASFTVIEQRTFIFNVQDKS